MEPSLAFDFSQTPQTIALGPNIQREIPRDTRADQSFPAALESAFAESPGHTLADVASYVTVAGPGSFTGLRIAYAAIKGLWSIHPVPVWSVHGHEILTLEWLARSGVRDGRVVAMTRVSSQRALASIYSIDGGAEKPLRGEGEFVTSMFIDKTFPSEVIAILSAQAIAIPIAPVPIHTVPWDAAAILRHFPRVTTAQKHEGPAAIIAASPIYYGSERFD